MEKLTKFINENSMLFSFIGFSFLVLQTVFLFVPINLLILIIIPVVHLLIYALAKDYLRPQEKSLGFKFVRIGVYLCVFDLIFRIFHAFNGLSKKAGSSAPFFLFLVLVSLISMVLYIFENKKETKEAIRDFYDTPFIKSKGGNRKKKPGDVKLCEDKETGEEIIIPYSDRFLHTLILGPTGSGKTSQVIIPMINQDMQNENAGITVLEPKGDLADKVMALSKHYDRECFYFNPIDPDCPSFNPLYGDESDVTENLVTTFKMLTADSSQYFQGINEQFLRNAIRAIKRVHGNKATMNDLFSVAFNTQNYGSDLLRKLGQLEEVSEETKKENNEVVSWFTSEYYNQRSKMYEQTSGIRSQIAKINSNKYLKRVLNPPDGGSDVNFDKILEEGGVLAISTAQGALRDLSRYLGYFIILNYQSSVFKRPGNEDTRRPHFLYIDEFQTYSNTGFTDMLTQGRSYRVSSNLATQNRALIGMGAGKDGKSFTQMVSTNARNVIIFPGCAAEDAEYYSREFGEKMTKELQKSISRPRFQIFGGGWGSESFREVEKRESNYIPTDIMFEEFGTIFYKIIQDKSVRPAGKGKIKWIPKELNDELNEIIEEHNKLQEEKRHGKEPVEVKEEEARDPFFNMDEEETLEEYKGKAPDVGDMPTIEHEPERKEEDVRDICSMEDDEFM